MNKLSAEWICSAVSIIENGICNKMEIDGITIYRCGKIIRIDIKSTGEKNDLSKTT